MAFIATQNVRRVSASAALVSAELPRAGRAEAPVEYEAILGGPVYAGKGVAVTVKAAADATPSKLAVERPLAEAAPPPRPRARRGPPARQRKRISRRTLPRSR